MKKLILIIATLLLCISSYANNVRVVVQNSNNVSVVIQQPHVRDVATHTSETIPNITPGSTCWETARRQWIRQPSKHKEFEEYAAIIAAHFASRFVGCLSRDCSKVREHHNGDIDSYVDGWMKDTLLINHYYDMEWYFEAKLSDLDFQHWKRNNQSWHDGKNWREYEKEIGGCNA